MTEEDITTLDLNRLRSLVRQYIDNQLYTTALFWADKICSLSYNNISDCLLLAYTLCLTKQYSRAANFLNSKNLVSNHPTARYLAAKCYYEEKDYTNALNTLENSDVKDLKLNKRDSNHNQQSPSGRSSCSAVFSLFESNSKLDSALTLLKGKVYDALENNDVAVKCYKDALQHDVYCFEAFDCLISHHALSANEETQLLKTLPFSQQCSPEEENLLTFLYESNINKYAKPVNQNLPTYLAPLEENLECIVTKAQRCFNNSRYKDALRYASSVIKKDPLHHTCLPLFVSCLVEFDMKNELYKIANMLVNTYPENAVSWYAVGSYYLLIGKSETARKYFSKSTTLDIKFGPAWLGFAHSYASKGEHDQAISAYYGASKVMPGSHLPYLYLGLEYFLSNNYNLAYKFYQEALLVSPDDPHIKIELGALAYQNKDYNRAQANLLDTLNMIDTTDENALPATLEPLYNNLGHTLRKLKQYDEAVMYFKKALLLNPRNSGTIASIGLCYFMKRDFEKAVVNFHKALGLKKQDAMCIQMLEMALVCLAQTLQMSVNEDKTLSSTSSIDLSCTSNTSTSKQLFDTPSIDMDDSSQMSLDMSCATPSP